MIKDQDFREFHYNVLGLNSKITGDLFLCGDSIITSEIQGNVVMQDEGKLILERGSKIIGSIKGIDVEIFGEVEGDIECRGLVSIRSGARVSGTIKSGRLVIYPGAIVEVNAVAQEET